eukprot:scaffold320638_cov46-Prasinocladus_malaysianus.AAC.3
MAEVVLPDVLTAPISWQSKDDTVEGIPVPEVGPMVIGALTCRACDCVVDEDQSLWLKIGICPLQVSGKHARVEFVPDKSENTIKVTDLQSTNGTFINGARLRPFSEVDAHEGDVVSFGGADFVVLCIPNPVEQPSGVGLIEPGANRPCFSAITAALRCATNLPVFLPGRKTKISPPLSDLAIASPHTLYHQQTFSTVGLKSRCGLVAKTLLPHTTWRSPCFSLS